MCHVDVGEMIKRGACEQTHHVEASTHQRWNNCGRGNQNDSYISSASNLMCDLGTAQ